MLTCRLVDLGDGHPWRRPNTPAPFFSKLKTLMCMISPIYFPVDANPFPQVAAAYAASASALDADLRAFGIPHTLFQPHCDGQDTAKPPGIRQSGSLEEGMRRDWLLRADAAQGLFTSEFWARTRRVEAVEGHSGRQVCGVFGRSRMDMIDGLSRWFPYLMTDDK